MFWRVSVCLMLLTASRLAAQPVWHVHSETIVVQDSAAIERSGIVSVAATRDVLLERSGSSTLSDAVSSLHPSFTLRGYGAQGSIALASFRGLPAEYISVDFGGFRLANAQNSLADLGLLDANILGKVTLRSTVSDGSSDADHGNATLGLDPIAISKNASSVTLGTEIGSYDDKLGAASTNGYLRLAAPLSNSVGMSLGAVVSSSDGDYPFVQHSTGATIERANNDAHLANGTLNLVYSPADNARLSLTSLYLRSERGSPGADTKDSLGASSPFERLFDERYLIGMLVTHKPSEEFEYNVRASYQSQFESFVDTISALKMNDRYTNRMISGGFDGVSHTASWVDLLTGVSADHAILISNENSIPGGGDITRDVYRANLGARVIGGPLVVSGSLRTEKYSSDNEAALLPQLSVRYGEDIVLFGYGLGASYSALYHAPTLNEFYWTVGGNPNLLPEKGHSLEVVADAHAAEFVTLKLVGFYNALRDQIVWQPVTSAIWSPFNVESSRSYGFEGALGVAIEPVGGWWINAAYSITLQRSEDRTDGSASFGHELPYSTPLAWTLTFSTSFRDYGELTVAAHYRGHRFPDLGNVAGSELPPVGLVNVSYRPNEWKLSSELRLRAMLSVVNVFDVQYQEIVSYPMPGRQFRVGIEINHSHQTEHE